MTPSIDDVQVFCQVVETGSFTAAGEALDRSKGAVSKAVSRLEASLSVRLLHRTTRRQTLTDAGERFYARATPVLEELFDATREVREQADRPSGVLRVSAPAFFGSEILSKLVGQFHERYPDITLELRCSNRFVDLVAERFDAAIRISAPEDSSLVMRKLADIPMVFCAAPSYLERNGKPETPADLSQHQCLIYTGSARPREWLVLDSDSEPHTVAVNGPIHTNDDATLRQAAIEGLGIVRMPKLFLRDALADGRLVQIWPEDAAPAATLGVVYPSRRELPAKVRVWIDSLVEWHRK